MKRLEYLEKQSEDRSKTMLADQNPLKRELERLKVELGEERVRKDRAIAKKNAEVTYFKKELDELLGEIAQKSR